MAICKQCNKEYEAIRQTSKYCSNACRKLAFLNKEDLSVPIDKVSVPKLSVLEDKPLSVPEDSKRIGKAIPGYCHGCGRKHSDIEPIGMPELRCICKECIKQGITHKSLSMHMCD